MMTTAKTIPEGAVFVTPDVVEKFDGVEGEDSQSCRRNLRIKFQRVHHDESPFSEGHHRRETRVKQRKLLNGMVSGETGWEEGRILNNEIFHTRVAYAREMVMDGDIGIAALRGFAKEVEQAHVAPRFNALKLVDYLSLKCSTQPGRFDWSLLGRSVGTCFSSAPPSGLSFLAGALDSKPRQRAKPKPRTKRAREEEDLVEETRPEVVTEKNKTNPTDQLSAMDKLRKKVAHRLLARTEEEVAAAVAGGEAPKLDAVQFLFNPLSFTQTIENIFTFSFLVKNRTAGIGVVQQQQPPETSDGGDEVSSPSLFVQKTDEKMVAPLRQSVCSFTMADFRLLKVNVERTDLPHRASAAANRGV